MSTHTGEKPRKKTFMVTSDHDRPDEDTLNEHQLIQAEMKPLENAYTAENTLHVHMLNQAERKPWICSVCGRVFADEGTLDEHLLTHVVP